jgi:hypothetical protein
MIRTINFLSWKQKTAWMENMKGPRWNSMVKKENELFLKTVNSVATKEELYSKTNDFIAAKKSIFFSYENLIIEQNSMYEYTWFYKDSQDKKYIVSDICIYKQYVYHIYDNGYGSQNNRLECLDGHTVVWYVNNVGPNVFVKDDLCYYFNIENKLRSNILISANYKNGKNKKHIYIEKDKRFNLNMVKGENDCLFLIRENSGKQNLFVIDNSKIIYENNKLQYYFPIGYHKGQICFLENNNNIWKSVGFTLEKTFSDEILYFSIKHNICILIESGCKKVYNLNFKLIYSFYGNIYINTFVENHFKRFFIDITGTGIQEFLYNNNKFISKDCKVFDYGTVIYHKTKRHVPIVLVKPLCKIKGLMVICYGAYGMSTNMSTTRWKPYIDDGWVVSFVCVRGSGDVSKSWAEQARTYNKIEGCIDLEESIVYIQDKYNISSNVTCIFGRSAGGYLIGSIISRNNKKHIFKMVYAEVPYVDVLRTTSNPKLPLTILEYDEFGNPNDGIYEFRKLMELSPVDSLDYMNPPDIFVIIRTSENDTQVYPYESYKWLEVLRGKYKNDTKKLLFLTENKGHFINGNLSCVNYSEDFFLLKSFREDEQKR